MGCRMIPVVGAVEADQSNRMGAPSVWPLRLRTEVRLQVLLAGSSSSVGLGASGLPTRHQI